MLRDARFSLCSLAPSADCMIRLLHCLVIGELHSMLFMMSAWLSAAIGAPEERAMQRWVDWPAPDGPDVAAA